MEKNHSHEQSRNITEEDVNQAIVTIREKREVMTAQKLPYFIGISNTSAGAKKISMNMVTIPPGAKADAHYHNGFETGIYVLKGKVETHYGERLENSVINEAGDFIFIPPYLPHQPVNLSATEIAQAIVVRDSADEIEDVVPYQV